MELFNPEGAVQSLGPLFAGLMLTVALTVIVIVLALALGLVVALARLYGPSPVSWAVATYVEVIRGTPLLLQLIYIYYVLPTVAGFFAHGRTWTAMGPWQLGRWYRPLAVVSALFCAFLIVVGMQPPNQQVAWIVGGAVALLALVWFAFERKRFRGPPQIS